MPLHQDTFCTTDQAIGLHLALRVIQRPFERQPGTMLFRTQVDKSNPRTLLVIFLVGETPTAGVHKEALRHWVRQAEADAGERNDRLTTSERERLRALERENRELRKANEILKAASVFFAKELDPTRPK